jgi:hypothetical protein
MRPLTLSGTETNFKPNFVEAPRSRIIVEPIEHQKVDEFFAPLPLEIEVALTGEW